MKKFIIAVVLLLGIAAGVAYYFYQKISYKPDWYAEAETADRYQLLTDHIDDLERRIVKDLKNGKSVKIPANRVVPLLVNQLEKKTGVEIRKTVKAVKTTISSDRIEMEMIIDLIQMPPVNLPKKVQKTIEQILKAVPKNALNELYIRGDLKTEKREKAINFDPISNISIGKMSLPLEELKKKLGTKQKLSLESFPISDFELKENAILLKPIVGKAKKQADSTPIFKQNKK